MKFIWMFLIIVILINLTRAKNLLNISKVSKPPKYTLANRRTIGLFPRSPTSRNTFIVDLKTPLKTHSQTIHSEQYKKPLMRKMSKEYINYKDNNKLKTEVTTRRSLMQAMKCNVRPHDVYAESIREKYNWNRYRKHVTYKSKTIKDKSTFLNIKNVDNDYNLFEKHNNKNSIVAHGSLKPKIISQFPKRDNTKYFKGSPEQRVFKWLKINNFVAESKVPSIVVNNGKNDKIIEENENRTVPSNVFINSDSKDQIDKMIETNENFFDQDEFIPVKEVNENTFVESDFTDDVEMTTDSDVDYLVSRPKRGVNIIEEESIATTFSGIKITNQDYSLSHDWTFKNIHT